MSDARKPPSANPMKKFYAALLVCSLVFAGCDRKEPKPIVTETDPARISLSERPGSIVQSAVDNTGAVGGQMRDTVSGKTDEWKLSTTDIKAELESTGRVVREKSASDRQKFGEEADNTRIATVINSKLVIESEAVAPKIDVGVDRGVVTLKGSVRSTEMVGYAIALALDTEGVSRVISLITVDPNT